MVIMSEISGKNIVIVSPHQDDETIGMYVTIKRLIGRGNGISVVYTTNGAPNEEYPQEIRGVTCHSQQEYSDTRKQESLTVLGALGIRETDIHFLGFDDKALFMNMEAVHDSLRGVFSGPDVIFSPPYEGAHPDHDVTRVVTAFAAGEVPLWEYALYNHVDGEEHHNVFLQPTGSEVVTDISSEERTAKRAAIELYRSHSKGIMSRSPLERETIRVAPVVDYQDFPAERPLFYERFFDLGVSATEVQERVRAFASDNSGGRA